MTLPAPMHNIDYGPFMYDFTTSNVRLVCQCGFQAPWRNSIDEIRKDERTHNCRHTIPWRQAKSPWRRFLRKMKISR